MGLFSLFRKRPPIRDAEALATFIDEQAAFLIQKAIYEYSRARAGHYAKVLFAEATFREAVERSRWQAYPLGLTMVAELAEGVLRPHVGEEGRDALTALVLSVFDRYPTPAALGATAWDEARGELRRQLELVATHGRKPVKDIPEPFAQKYFSLMPIHQKLRGPDFPTIRNYLSVTLCNIHDELTKRMDPQSVAACLFTRETSKQAP